MKITTGIEKGLFVKRYGEIFFKIVYAVLDRRAWRALLFSRNMMRRLDFLRSF
ncbi:hypothetical protein SELSPUOL_01188 [Selenomonas sputigena ATCC 35185]|uniref:Uncharacterized protein n=1 Tax=Selenomonas sputigena (strain ATCC 35185 / DSM 20758 / CCUG 44933 / VPI D19B-28) TaxID=546271 RepID=C9LUQ3_SELS3|nr:hypothetical protein SELSPUOL_01188 [Selenomonas sputigena ATCC 35185]